MVFSAGEIQEKFDCANHLWAMIFHFTNLQIIDVYIV